MIDINFNRIKLAHKEEADYERSRTKVLEKILDRKTAESNIRLKEKISEAEKSESALFNILEDVKEMEDVLKEKGERLKTIISAMGDGLLVIDRDYRIQLMNPTAERLLEIDTLGVIGQDAKKFIIMYKGDQLLPDDERPVARMFKNRQSVIISSPEEDLYYQTVNGKKFPVAISVTPLLQDNGISGAVVVFRDISDTKALDEARKSFISLASHQLRSPLTVIRWYVELFNSDEFGKLTKKQKGFLNDIHVSALKLIDTIDLFLSLSRAESGKMELNLAKADILAFTKGIIKELTPLFKEKKLKASLDFKGSVLETNFDASLLRQVLINLISNAVRYTNESGKIEIGLDKNSKEVVCFVKDDGIGIPENQKDKVFGKFFRADNAITKIQNGTGLGLSLVKALVETWKGRVWFESPATWLIKGRQEKKGTIFYFTIPI
ncbi:MAG: ATP-binding protein [Patescibacteria group bacterium]